MTPSSQAKIKFKGILEIDGRQVAEMVELSGKHMTYIPPEELKETNNKIEFGKSTGRGDINTRHN